MPNSSSGNNTAGNTLLRTLQERFPAIQFRAGSVFRWSPGKGHVEYDARRLHHERGHWALIHEASHALLGHTDYQSDFELLTMEVAAWERAKALATDLGIHIDPDHIQDCLDTYRDWLHRRSTCPTCGSVSLQRDPSTYHCHNCLATWRVSAERFCRPYRRIATST